MKKNIWLFGTVAFCMLLAVGITYGPARADQLDIVLDLSLPNGRFMTSYTNPLTFLPSGKLLFWDEPLTIVDIEKNEADRSKTIAEKQCADGLRLYRFSNGIGYLCLNREADGTLTGELSLFDSDISPITEIRIEDVFVKNSYSLDERSCDVTADGENIFCAVTAEGRVLLYNRATAEKRSVWDYLAELNSIDGLAASPDGNYLYFAGRKGANNERVFGYYDAAQNTAAFRPFEKVNVSFIQTAPDGALFLEEIGDPYIPVSGKAFLVRPGESEEFQELTFGDPAESREAYLSDDGQFIATVFYDLGDGTSPRTIRIRIFSADPFAEIRNVLLTDENKDTGFVIHGAGIDGKNRSLFVIYANGGRDHFDRYDF